MTIQNHNIAMNTLLLRHLLSMCFLLLFSTCQTKKLSKSPNRYEYQSEPIRNQTDKVNQPTKKIVAPPKNFIGNLYVSTSGNDTNDGSFSKPFKTITHGASVLQPGDTLFIRGGTYTEQIKIRNSGTANQPIIIKGYPSEEIIVDGRIPLTNWTNVGPNIWEARHPNLSNRPTALTLNNEIKPLGRYPNRQVQNNGGYLEIEGHSNKNNITSQSLNGLDWSGAEIVVRADRWMLDRATVTSNSSSSITFSPAVSNIRDGYGFFIQDHPSTLDINGDWCYQPNSKTIRIYTNTSPSSQNIQVSNNDYGMEIEGQHHIIIDGLTFMGSKLAALRIYSASNCTIQNCQFKKSGTHDILLGEIWTNTFASDINISNNSFSETQSTCIVGGGTKFSIDHNNFTDICMSPGMGVSGNNYMALKLLVDDLLIEKNRFERVGFMPMQLLWSSNTRVNKNFIDTYCIILDDGAGVYFFTGSGLHPTENRIVTNNIILNGIGVTDGVKDKTLKPANGIYFDDNSKDIIAAGNTIAHCSAHGIYFHNSPDCSALNNTIFSCSEFIYFQSDDIGDLDITNCTVKENIAVSADVYEEELMFTFVGFGSHASTSQLQHVGEIDNNYYCRPFAGEQYIRAFNQKFNLQEWRDYSGYDRNTKLSPLQYPTYDVDQDVRFEYNDTDSRKTIIADQDYITPDGKIFAKGQSIIIPTFESIVLLKIDDLTSVVDMSAGPLTVYPNPVRNALQVKGTPINTDYHIYDLSGRLIQKGKISSWSLINVQQLDAGYYILTLLEKGNKKISFIKQ